MSNEQLSTWTGYDAARRRLVSRLVEAGIISTPAVEAAFRAVPRETFVPADSPNAVYADTTIPVEGAGGSWLTTSSQPTMMAIMLEQLSVRPGDRVLEIGSGTGYNAALLCHIVGPDGVVDSVEIEPEAAARAASALAAVRLPARVHAADGSDGWPDGAPYDRIISTVAVWDIPAPWERQTTADARIVTPLTILGGDYAVALKREGEGWVSESIEPCAFVRFKGRLAHPECSIAMGDRDAPSLTLLSEPGNLPAEREVRRWLENGEGESLHASGGRCAWDAMAFWLIHQRGASGVVRAVSLGRGLGWQGHALGIWDDDGMALFTANGRLEWFGDGATADELRAVCAAWRAAGSPALERFHIRVRPRTPAEGPWLPRWTHSLRVELR